LGGDEAAVELGPIDVSIDHRPSEYVIRTLAAMVRCLFGRWRQAFDELDALDDFARVVAGAWQLCDHATFHGLAAAALLTVAAVSQQLEWLVWGIGFCLVLPELAGELGQATAVPLAALLEAGFHVIEGNSPVGLAAFARARWAAVEQRLIW